MCFFHRTDTDVAGQSNSGKKGFAAVDGTVVRNLDPFFPQQRTIVHVIVRSVHPEEVRDGKRKAN